MNISYASLCDGIGAVHCAWQPLGWRCAWTSEIDKFPIAVVEARWPGIPNLGDMTQITQEMLDEHGPIDLIVGGTPCQSFSVAGLRGGLDDARGHLALRFMQLCAAARPRWVVWENVPGVLSVDGGRAFGAILGALAELGYGFAWRVLDAQHFGVPQRRRRVFVVGCLGDWRRAAAVLLEQRCLRGDPPTSRTAGKDAPAAVGRGASVAIQGNLVGRDAGGPHGVGAFEGGAMYTLTKNDVHAVAVTEPVPYDLFQITAPVNRQNRNCGDPCHTLAKDNAAHAAIVHTEDRMVVRRLTPCECERLQGFPDQYTQIPWRKKPAEDCPDGHRYRALGNSMAVPVMRWIGERIATVDRIACVPSNERTES
jgi:DNA (cytosine-5)-methyltransferase 1